MEDVKLVISVDNYDCEKEYRKIFDFISQGSSSITVESIKYALKNIDRKDARAKLFKVMPFENIVEDIEKSIFEFSLVNATVNDFPNNYITMIYQDKLNTIYDNLDTNNKRIDNQTLNLSILEDRVNPLYVPFLPPEQLHPMRFKDVLDKLNLRDQTLNSLQTTDMYKCKKCGERKFKISTMQTRCADEPETKFLTCVVCYNTFTK